MSELYKQYYREYFDLVFGLLFKRTRDLEDAEDLTQDTFLRFLKFDEGELKHIEKTVGVKPYLITIAKNRFIDEHRRKNGRAKTISFEETTRAETSHYSETQGEYESRSVWVHNEEYILNNIDKYISDEIDSFIYIQYYSEDYSYKQIREELLEIGIDKSIDAIKQRKSRTLKQLKRLIGIKHPNFLTEKIIVK